MIDTAFKNGALFTSGRVTNHKSAPRVYKMYFPFLDQSHGNLLRSSCTKTCSSWVPSRSFAYRSKSSVRFEAYTNPEASGFQMGRSSKPRSNVSRLAPSPCNSYVQTSVFKLDMSV